jgi:uncharacterized cupredoxin-like copper-binding protein
MRSGGVQGTRAVLALAGCVALVAGATGCGATGGHDNLVNGKEQFVAKCGACHTLARAGSTGVNGPNLDEAFKRARLDGFGESTFAGIVHKQILFPSKLPQVDPATGKVLGLMPADLVTGTDAKDVAAYVAASAAAGGKESGRLAAVGAQPKGTAKAEGGVLSIPVNEAGGTFYQFANAEAPAGQIKFESKNDQPIPHDIAVEGNGVDDKGEVVSNGGTSTFTADLEPGKYTFYCTVPGHRASGMEGPLTVK